MNIHKLDEVRYKYVSHNATVEDLVKELIRKTIHLCAAFVPLLARYFYNFTIIALSTVTALYIALELLRLHGINTPIISRLTQIASRKRDEGKFVLGPVTLALGVIASLIIFQPPISTIAIFSLAFGDGLASLIGKIYGQIYFTRLKKKTLAGSLACFTGVFLTTIFLTNILNAFLIAVFTTIIELIPIKDFDNLLIPISVGFLAQFLQTI